MITKQKPRIHDFDLVTKCLLTEKIYDAYQIQLIEEFDVAYVEHNVRHFHKHYKMSRRGGKL